MTYTCQNLRVRDWMVGCRTFRKWRYGGRCHFGCSFLLFSSLLFTSLLLYFFTSFDLGPVQMASARVFTTSGDKSNGGEVSPCAGSAERLPSAVLIGCGTYGFVCLRTLNGCLIVFFPFLLLYWFMQPRGSAPKEGDNVTARLHVTCPEPGNTRFI